MFARRLAIGGMILATLLAAAPAHAGRVSDEAMERAGSRGRARVLVLLEDGAAMPAKASMPADSDSARSRQARITEVRGRVDDLLRSLPRAGHAMRRRFALIPALAMEADAATLRRLRDHPGVRRVDLDLPMHAAAFAPDQASVLNRVAELESVGLDGRGMKVAVIDSGVDTDHPDLRAALVDEHCFCRAESGGGGCCPNGQATQAGAGASEDGDGHGTHVSGIILGRGNAAPRGALPAAQLVAVRVLGNDGHSCCFSDVLAAMDWLAVQHPDVDAVNLSLGTDDLFTGECDNASAFTQAVRRAVANLETLGAVTVAAAGNDASTTQSSAPACVSNTLSVGATWDDYFFRVTFDNCTDSNTVPMMPTCFSNRSTATDLFAAGAMVTAPARGGGMASYAGTSQATPMVTACAVALKQAAPAATVAQRVEAMTLSPTRIEDPLSGRSYPFLDCRDAVQLLNPAAFAIRVNGAHPLIPGQAPGSGQIAMPAPAAKAVNAARAPLRPRPAFERGRGRWSLRE